MPTVPVSAAVTTTPRRPPHDRAVSEREILDAAEGLLRELPFREVTVERIVVTSLSNEVFYARILAQVDGRRLEIDSRPSDAIAVAVRVGAGIFVADEVLDKAGVLPESDKDGELTEADPESEERLAKIRDWVNTLNLPDLGTGASES